MQLTIGRAFLSIAALLLCVWLGLTLSIAARAAEPPAAPTAAAVGEVLIVQGVATAQRPGATPRFLQKGEALHEGEVVSTGATGYTVIGFRDGTKFTLRPNTSFAIEGYRHGGGEKDSAGFRLIKGGLRAITGLISKRDPNAMQINTTTATIGIRGTAFDARLCEAECAAEQSRAPRKPAAATEPVVARVIVIAGAAQASGTGGQARTLAEGSALFNGDTVRTEKASHVVLAFRDQSKVTVIADSEFKLEDVRFGPRSESGNFAVRIVRGGVRALTGLLGKANPKAVNFGITNAVIGLRGSGWDGYIGAFAPPGQASAPGAFVNTWFGGTDVRVGDRTEPVDEGQTIVLSPPDTFTRLDKPPPFPDPVAARPDKVPDPDYDALFREVQVELPGAGLHVGMRLESGQRLGQIVLRGPLGFIYLEGEEGGWLPDGQGVPVRTFPNWASRMNADLPLPETVGAAGAPGALDKTAPVICEIR